MSPKSGAFGISQRNLLIPISISTIPGQVSLVTIGAFIAAPTLAAGIVVALAWAAALKTTLLAYRRRWKASRR